MTDATFPGIDPPPEKPNSARLDAMYRRYGKSEGHTCGTCIYLVSNQAGKRIVFKCLRTRRTSSAATDWRKHWEACGGWEKHPGKREPTHD